MPGGTKEDHEIFSQDNRTLDPDMILRPQEYKAGVPIPRR